MVQINFTYLDAYSRNIGFLTKEDQEILKNSKVAIAGMGGVGGNQAVAMARLGIGELRIMDPFFFDPPDFNRQYGAKEDTLGKNKGQVMEEELKKINPFMVTKLIENCESLDDLFEVVNLAVDAIDYGAFDYKIKFFQKAREKGIYALSCPIPGTSAVLHTFSPEGMTAEEYFQAPKDKLKWSKYKIPINRMSPEKIEQIPKEIFERIEKGEQSFPTLSPIAFLSAGILSFEALIILTNKKKPVIVPKVTVIDFYKGTYNIINNT